MGVSNGGRARTLQDVGSATASDLARPILLLAVFTSTWGAVSVGGLQLVDVFLVIAAALACLDGVTSNRRLTGPWWIWVGLATIFVVGATHVLLPSGDGYRTSRFTLLNSERLIAPDGSLESLTIGLRWIVAVAVLPLVAGCLAGNKKHFVPQIATAFVAGIALSSIVAVADWSGLSQIGPSLIGGASITGRQNGLASHVNNLGFACVIATPLALHLYGRRRLLAVTALIVIGAGAFVSGSRTAQVGVILALVISMICLKVARRAAFGLIALGSIAAAAVFLYTPGLLQSLPKLIRFESAGGVASDIGRSMVAQQAIRDFTTYPFMGAGLPFITSAHSVPLQLLASGGLLLTTGMILYWAGAVRWGLKYRRDAESIGLAATLSLTLWLVQFAFQNQLVDRFLYVPIALIVAVAAASTTDLPRMAKPSLLPRSYARPLPASR